MPAGAAVFFARMVLLLFLRPPCGLFLRRGAKRIAVNTIWAKLSKTMQAQRKKKIAYDAGISTLFDLRNQLMETFTSFHAELRREDIAAHTLTDESKQVFFSATTRNAAIYPSSQQGMSL